MTAVLRPSAVSMPELGSQLKSTSLAPARRAVSKRKMPVGKGLIDWIRLCRSKGTDLTGVGGVRITVTPEQLAQHNKEEDCMVSGSPFPAGTVLLRKTLPPAANAEQLSTMGGSFVSAEWALSMKQTISVYQRMLFICRGYTSNDDCQNLLHNNRQCETKLCYSCRRKQQSLLFRENLELMQCILRKWLSNLGSSALINTNRSPISMHFYSQNRYELKRAIDRMPHTINTTQWVLFHGIKMTSNIQFSDKCCFLPTGCIKALVPPENDDKFDGDVGVQDGFKVVSLTSTIDRREMYYPSSLCTYNTREYVTDLNPPSVKAQQELLLVKLINVFSIDCNAGNDVAEQILSQKKEQEMFFICEEYPLKEKLLYLIFTSRWKSTTQPPSLIAAWVCCPLSIKVLISVEWSLCISKERITCIVICDWMPLIKGKPPYRKLCSAMIAEMLQSTASSFMNLLFKCQITFLSNREHMLFLLSHNWNCDFTDLPVFTMIEKIWFLSLSSLPQNNVALWKVFLVQHEQQILMRKSTLVRNEDQILFFSKEHAANLKLPSLYRNCTTTVGNFLFVQGNQALSLFLKNQNDTNKKCSLVSTSLLLVRTTSTANKRYPLENGQQKLLLTIMPCSNICTMETTKRKEQHFGNANIAMESISKQWSQTTLERRNTNFRAESRCFSTFKNFTCEQELSLNKGRPGFDKKLQKPSLIIRVPAAKHESLSGNKRQLQQGKTIVKWKDKNSAKTHVCLYLLNKWHKLTFFSQENNIENIPLLQRRKQSLHSVSKACFNYKYINKDKRSELGNFCKHNQWHHGWNCTSVCGRLTVIVDLWERNAYQLCSRDYAASFKCLFIVERFGQSLVMRTLLFALCSIRNASLFFCDTEKQYRLLNKSLLAESDKQQPTCNCRICVQTTKPISIEILLLSLSRSKQSGIMISQMEWRNKECRRREIIERKTHHFRKISTDSKWLPKKGNLTSKQELLTYEGRLSLASKTQAFAPIFAQSAANQVHRFCSKQQLCQWKCLVKWTDKTNVNRGPLKIPFTSWKKQKVRVILLKISEQSYKPHFFYKSIVVSKFLYRYIYGYNQWNKCLIWHSSEQFVLAEIRLSLKQVALCSREPTVNVMPPFMIESISQCAIAGNQLITQIKQYLSLLLKFGNDTQRLCSLLNRILLSNRTESTEMGKDQPENRQLELSPTSMLTSEDNTDGIVHLEQQYMHKTDCLMNQLHLLSQWPSKEKTTKGMQNKRPSKHKILTGNRFLLKKKNLASKQELSLPKQGSGLEKNLQYVSPNIAVPTTMHKFHSGIKCFQKLKIIVKWKDKNGNKKFIHSILKSLLNCIDDYNQWNFCWNCKFGKQTILVETRLLVEKYQIIQCSIEGLSPLFAKEVLRQFKVTKTAEPIHGSQKNFPIERQCCIFCKLYFPNGTISRAIERHFLQNGQAKLPLNNILLSEGHKRKHAEGKKQQFMCKCRKCTQVIPYKLHSKKNRPTKERLTFSFKEISTGSKPLAESKNLESVQELSGLLEKLQMSSLSNAVPAVRYECHSRSKRQLQQGKTVVKWRDKNCNKQSLRKSIFCYTDRYNQWCFDWNCTYECGKQIVLFEMRVDEYQSVLCSRDHEVDLRPPFMKETLKQFMAAARMLLFVQISTKLFFNGTKQQSSLLCKLHLSDGIVLITMKICLLNEQSKLPLPSLALSEGCKEEHAEDKKQQPMCNCTGKKPALVDKLHIVFIKRKENITMKSDLMQWSSKEGTRIRIPNHQSGGISTDHRSLPKKGNLASNKKMLPHEERLSSASVTQVPVPVITYPTANQSCYCNSEQQLYLKISIVKWKDKGIRLNLLKKWLMLPLKNKVLFFSNSKQSLHRNSKSHFYYGESMESKLFSRCIYWCNYQCFCWNFTCKTDKQTVFAEMELWVERESQIMLCTRVLAKNWRSLSIKEVFIQCIKLSTEDRQKLPLIKVKVLPNEDCTEDAMGQKQQPLISRLYPLSFFMQWSRKKNRISERKTRRTFNSRGISPENSYFLLKEKNIVIEEESSPYAHIKELGLQKELQCFLLTIVIPTMISKLSSEWGKQQVKWEDKNSTEDHLHLLSKLGLLYVSQKNKILLLDIIRKFPYSASKSFFNNNGNINKIWKSQPLIYSCIQRCFDWRHANNFSRKITIIELWLFKYQIMLSSMKHETSFRHLGMNTIYAAVRKTLLVLFRSCTSKEFRSGTSMEKSYRKTATRGTLPCGNQLSLLLNREPNFTVDSPASLRFNRTENVPEEHHTKNKQKYSMAITISTNENCKTNSKKKRRQLIRHYNKKHAIAEVNFSLMNEQASKNKPEKKISLKRLRKGKVTKRRDAALIKGDTLQISKHSKCITKENISTGNQGLPPGQGSRFRTEKLPPPSTDTDKHLSDKLQFKLWESIVKWKDKYSTGKRLSSVCDLLTALFTEVSSASGDQSSPHRAANPLNRCAWCRQWHVSCYRNNHAKCDIVIVERSSWICAKRTLLKLQSNSHVNSFFYLLLQPIVTTLCNGTRGYIRIYMHLPSNFIFHILLQLTQYGDFTEINMMVS